MTRGRLFAWLAFALAALPAHAREIRIGPLDAGYADIEAAQAGDEVVIASGTYQFRVNLRANGTADAGIVVRGEDPASPPVFDYTGRNIELFRIGYLPIKGLSMLSYEMNDERWIPAKLRRPFQVVPYGSTARTATVRGKEGFASRPGANRGFPEIAVPIAPRRIPL